MHSLGEKLRTAREEKNLSLDQASRDTNIAVRYLQALEAENFSDFPGEPYITGFLRNYGTYLELNVQELLSLYRAFRIQEQPVPVEQLLRSPSKLPKVIVTVAIILIILGIGGGGAYYYFFARPNRPAPELPTIRAPAEYVMSGNTLERRLYSGDSILVPVETSQYKLELTNLGEAVTIRTPGGPVILDLSQEANIDLTNNGIPDLRITIIDFAKNNASMGVLLRFDMVSFIAADPVAEGMQDSVQAISAAGLANTRVILSSPNPYPFTLQSQFLGYCMFRWEILFERDRRDRNERYFQRSDELSIQAQNGIRIWTSNAQAARFQVIGGGQTVPLELGVAGEVVVADVRWVRDEDNRYRLVLVRLETGT